MTRKGEQPIEETVKDGGELPEFPESLKNIGDLAAEAASGEVEAAMDQIHSATPGADCLACGAKIYKSFTSLSGEELDKEGLCDLLSCFVEYQKSYLTERAALWEIIEEFAPKAKEMGQQSFVDNEERWELAKEEVLLFKKENAALKAELENIKFKKTITVKELNNLSTKEKIEWQKRLQAGLADIIDEEDENQMLKKENSDLRAKIEQLTGKNNSAHYQEFIANPQNKKEFDELVLSMGLKECPPDQRQAVINIIIQRRK